MEERTEILPHYTYADYVHWEDQENSELIGGTRYVMQPSPTLRHQRLATRLTCMFFNQLKDAPTCTVYQPVDYWITDDTILQPDMLIVCGEVGEKYLDFPPVLVTEILSPSTASKDRNLKFPLYQSQGVRYYLIISPKSEEIEIYQLENGKYVLQAKGRDISFAFFLGGVTVEIDFKEIW